MPRLFTNSKIKGNFEYKTEFDQLSLILQVMTSIFIGGIFWIEKKLSIKK
jgi:hypothetical protein